MNEMEKRMEKTMWRKNPPTLEEIKQCPNWWHRENDGKVFLADVKMSSGLVSVDGEEWAPCVPPTWPNN